MRKLSRSTHERQRSLERNVELTRRLLELLFYILTIFALVTEFISK